MADDIAYLNADLEDGVKKGIVNITQILKGFEEVEEHNKVTAACYNELKKKASATKGKKKVSLYNNGSHRTSAAN